MTIYDYVSNIIALGYCPIPGFRTPDGGTAPLAPFRDGEIYPADCKIVSKRGNLYNPWERAEYIGLRLDRCILVDYDGNKGRPELTLGELAGRMGVATLKPAMVQYGLRDDGKPNGSFHFMYLLPRMLNPDAFYQSQDGHFSGIDFKTGNQLCWIKRGKVQNFPAVEQLQPATRAMIEILRKPVMPQQSADWQMRQGGQGRGMAWLNAAADNLAGMNQGGRNHALNSTALAACRHALANEFPLGLAESMIKGAARQCGLKEGEITATWRSARMRAEKDGPKNLLERPK